MPEGDQQSPQQQSGTGGTNGAQPPIGSSPATGPTQNRGYDVAAVKMAGMGLKVLEMVIPLAGSSSELGRAAMESIKKISPHVPPGAVTPADMRAILQQLMIRQNQFSQQMATMRGGGGQQQQPRPQPGAQPQQQPQQQAAA